MKKFISRGSPKRTFSPSKESSRVSGKTESSEIAYSDQQSALQKYKTQCSSPDGSVFPGGDPVCPAGTIGFRVEGSDLSIGCTFVPANIIVAIGVAGFQVAICTLDMKSFVWFSTLSGIVSVTVKGGNGGCDGNPDNQNTCFYNNDEILDDVPFSAPPDSNCVIPDIDFIDFCVDRDLVILSGLEVSKTANTRFDRTHEWNIVKSSGGVTDITLAAGQSISQPYTVTLSETSVDSNWQIYGEVSLFNNNSNFFPGDSLDITINSVTDLVPSGAIVTGPSLPYLLVAGASVTFDYVANVPNPVNSPSGTNIATVNATYTDTTRNFNAEAGWNFADATINIIDSCVSVQDDRAGALGQVCFDSPNKQFNYSVFIGPYNVCGDYQFTNRASFTSLVGGRGLSQGTTFKSKFGKIVSQDGPNYSSVTINIHVPCEQDCTQTSCYWKDNAICPFDATWNQLPGGPETIFFYSRRSYYRVLQKGLRTPVSGKKSNFCNCKNKSSCCVNDPYYILAIQYIAAELNQLAGTSIPPHVLDAYNQATELFDDCENTPRYVCKRKRLRRKFRELACILEQYNLGEVGPGSC